MLRMKNVCSDEKLGEFILSCMKFTAKCKAFLKTVKVPCDVCGKEIVIEDTHTCDKCGKSVCSDCATSQGIEPDDPKTICTNCIEAEYENR